MFYGGHSTRKEWDLTIGVTPQLIVDEISEMVKNSGAGNIPWKNWFINCDTVSTKFREYVLLNSQGNQRYLPILLKKIISMKFAQG